MVEMTLDQCVQRLRKRIANEDRGKVMSSNHRGLGDRVPSFYTSRSIVNLSGLSVSDPSPLADGSSYRDDMASVLAKHQQQSSPSPSRQEHQNVAKNLANELSNDCVDYDEKIVLHDDSEIVDGDGLVKPIGRNKSADILSNNSDVSVMSSSDTELRRHNSDDSTQSQKVVEKTTSMANFYYRQAPNASP
jgi:hypothetical protein